MTWSELGSQFALELAFGVLLALAFVPRAPVGKLFYRLMGGTAVAALALAALAPPLSGGDAWSSPAVLGALVALAAAPLYAAQPRGPRWWVGLGLALVAVAAAVGARLAGALELSAGELALATLTALSTGAVAGSVGLAMVLGHWYLTVPKLDVAHLARLNRVCVVSMAVCLASVGVSGLVFADRLGDAGRPLADMWGLFYLGTRVAVGLLVPLAFAWMTKSSLAHQNTRSATGILYASTILVLIGAAVSVSLQDSYGVPL